MINNTQPAYTKDFQEREGGKSEELYNYIKNLPWQEINFDNILIVWRLWVEKDSETWRNFFLRYQKRHNYLGGVEREKDSLYDFFSGRINDIDEFANEWVAEDERESFLRFYVQKKVEKDYIKNFLW